MPEPKLYHILSGNQAPQPTATPGAPGVVAGDQPQDEMDLLAAKYGWGPLQLKHMKEMRAGSAPAAVPSPIPTPTPQDPYLNVSKALLTGKYIK